MKKIEMNLQSLSKAAASLGESNLLNVALRHFIRGIEDDMLPPGEQPDMGCWEAPEAEALRIQHFIALAGVVVRDMYRAGMTPIEVRDACADACCGK